MSWIETSTGNRISKSARIAGSNRILISGNTTINDDVTLHGDVPFSRDQEHKTSIQIGKYCYVGPRVNITPPKVSADNEEASYGPSSIGGYCVIGQDSEIRSANIGNRVLIEPSCVVSNLVIIYDCCIIREGTIIPPKMVIPPFSEVKGVPGVDFTVKELHNSYKKLIELEAKERQLLG